MEILAAVCQLTNCLYVLDTLKFGRHLHDQLDSFVSSVARDHRGI